MNNNHFTTTNILLSTLLLLFFIFCILNSSSLRKHNFRLIIFGSRNESEKNYHMNQDLNLYSRISNNETLRHFSIISCMRENSLEQTLENASMKDGTIILTVFTEGFIPFFDLFLTRMRIGVNTFQYLKHVVAVTFNEKDKRICCERHIHCYLDEQGNSSHKSEYSGNLKEYLSEDYINLTWRKVEVKLQIIKLRYHIFFTDCDAVWLKDPFPHMPLIYDITTSCDSYKPYKNCHNPNTGLYFVRSNNRTIQFYEYWLSMRYMKCNNCKDQDVFDMIIPRKDKFTKYIIKLRMKHVYSYFFGSLCNHPSDLDQIVIIHATCKIGFENKYIELSEFLTYYDWMKDIPT